MYDFGTIVLVPFPFTDLSAKKLRPALVVSKKNMGDDVILAFISSKLAKGSPDIYLTEADKVFPNSGLKLSSTICLSKLATLDKKLILGELGKLPKVFLKKYKEKFFGIFGF